MLFMWSFSFTKLKAMKNNTVLDGNSRLYKTVATTDEAERAIPFQS